MRERYGVVRCDEGGTLFTNDGASIDHTWDVIDRHTIVNGHPKTVQNCDTRKAAREVAREMNEQSRALPSAPVGDTGVSPQS